MFHLFFRYMLQACLFGCYICFYIYVSSVLSGGYVCFTIVFTCFCKCFSRMFQVFQLSFFFCMLQVLHLNISKVDRVLHIECAWEGEGHERYPRGATFGGMVPAWPRDVGAGKQRLAGMGPCMDVGKQTTATNIRSDASSAIPSFCYCLPYRWRNKETQFAFFANSFKFN